MSQLNKLASQPENDAQFRGVRLPGKHVNSLWDVRCVAGCISTIREHKEFDVEAAIPDGRLLTKSLCHPHIHLDKCFLLSHPRYADLEIQHGHFTEAMQLTSRYSAILFHP